MIDYDLILMMAPFFNDLIYISEIIEKSEDSPKCGRILLPCLTFSYGLTKIETFVWNAISKPPSRE
jgi:hypothetical protein